eukprot:TRINITY_DN915_c0_g7_i1.p1 TRINITY_DN915_c0_g7~~TRINITY_DN915_c0_g7_i1.p1  ORF type:complete len:119 (-),score=7.73 TRINITY_DN915_c0_g7_i1:43-399(-)
MRMKLLLLLFLFVAFCLAWRTVALDVCAQFQTCESCATNEECFYCSVDNGFNRQGRCLSLSAAGGCPYGAATASSSKECGCISVQTCDSCVNSNCSWCEPTLTCGGGTLAVCSTGCEK